MTIRHLKIFIAVCDCSKMSLAAKKLYITQPSVSQAISEIEQNYGVKLFERPSNTIKINNVKLGRTFNLVYHKNKYISENIKNFIFTCLNF